MCKSLEDIPHLAPGWGCCQCNIYNGIQRGQCRVCGHSRCKVGTELPPLDDGCGPEGSDDG